MFSAKSHFDWPSVLVAVISSFALAVFFYLNSVFAEIPTLERNINILEIIIYIFFLSVLWILDWVFTLVIVLLIITTLISFITSSSVSELKNTIYLLSDPILRSVRKN